MNHSLARVVLLAVCGVAASGAQQPMDEGGQPPATAPVEPSAQGQLTARMQEVLDELAALKGKPIETLTPAEARKQPTIADAAKAWLKHHKDLAPKTPEEVADIDNTHYQRGQIAAGAAGSAGADTSKEKLRIY